MVSTILIKFIILLSLTIVFGQTNPRFQYSTDYKNNRDEPSDVITFPDEVDEEPQDKKSIQETMIPVDLLMKISSVSNLSQFFEEFISMDSVDPRDVVSRFGTLSGDNDNIERSSGIRPIPAGCKTESMVVPLIPLDGLKDPTMIYFPSCTRVKRCSGCCTHALLSCQPTETEILTFEVIKSQFTGGTKMAYKGKELILVDQHNKCKCDCRIKESDCNSFQKYDKSQCKCFCTNYDDQSKCISNSEKIWDTINCTCRCRDSMSCTTGTYFDETTCRCRMIPTVQPQLDRRQFILKPVPAPTNSGRYQNDRY